MKMKKWISIMSCLCLTVGCFTSVLADENPYTANLNDKVYGDDCQNVKILRIDSDVQKIKEGGEFPENELSRFENLEEIQADTDYFVSVDGVLFNRDMTELVKYPPKKQGESYTVPNGVKRLYTEAFSDCEYLKHIQLPDSLEGDLYLTFYEAKALEEIVIPEGVTGLYYIIGENPSLKSISIPSTVEEISGMHIKTTAMFLSCPCLEDINVADTNKKYKSDNGILYVYDDGNSEWSRLAIPQAKALQALPTSSKIIIDGKEVKCEAYNILDNNYFKLRDVAYLLNGSAKQFNVTWDAEAGSAQIINGTPYERVGGECALGDGSAKTAYYSRQSISGIYALADKFNINGNNFVAIRDIGSSIGFNVDWDAENNAVIIDTSK